MHPKLYSVCLLLITFHEIMSKAISWLQKTQFHDLCILNADLLMISR